MYNGKRLIISIIFVLLVIISGCVEENTSSSFVSEAVQSQQNSPPSESETSKPYETNQNREVDTTPIDVRPGEWTTIYSTEYTSDKVNPFEFNPNKVTEGELYPDTPCTKARVENGVLILTGVPLQKCWIEGFQESVWTDWSTVTTITHKEEYIFPHPKLRLEAKIMFPPESFGDNVKIFNLHPGEDITFGEVTFDMNPEIFVNKARGNYNIFAQIMVSNNGQIAYVGEKDTYYKLDKITIEPDTWYTVVLEVDMKTREYIKASVGEKEWDSSKFKHKFTIREDNGVDDFKPIMGFWVENKLGDGKELYVDSLKVQISR